MGNTQSQRRVHQHVAGRPRAVEGIGVGSSMSVEKRAALPTEESSQLLQSHQSGLLIDGALYTLWCGIFLFVPHGGIRNTGTILLIQAGIRRHAGASTLGP